VHPRGFHVAQAAEAAQMEVIHFNSAKIPLAILLCIGLTSVASMFEKSLALARAETSKGHLLPSTARIQLLVCRN
jgi:hypothetical protein